MVTNGPITMALNDTAQVVLALVYGSSGDNVTGDNLKSITDLKTNDLTAQIVFDQLFQLPSIEPPVVQVTNLNNKVVLNWGNDLTSINEIEYFEDQNYTFEGYEVYQLPTSSSALIDGTLLGTFDVVNGVTAIYDTVKDVNGTDIPVLAADGKDKGIQRFLVIDYDNIRNEALHNGQEYYFAVVSYAYNPAPLLPFHVLRSPFVIKSTVPQTTLPGDRLSSSPGDSLSVEHAEGTSDGFTTALVIDPTLVLGHSYEVTFRDDGGIVWDVTDVSMSPPVVKVSAQVNQSGGNDYPIVDGILVKVEGPPLEGKEFDYASADPLNISPVALQTDPEYEGGRWFTGGGHGGEIFFGGVFLEPNFWGLTSLQPGEHKTVRIDFRPMASYTDLNANSAYDIGEPYVVDDPSQTQKAFMYQTFWRVLTRDGLMYLLQHGILVTPLIHGN